jgi:hypothetical protein
MCIKIPDVKQHPHLELPMADSIMTTKSKADIKTAPTWRIVDSQSLPW